MPNCGMLELLYAQNLAFLFLYLFNSVIGILGNRFLNMLTDIKLPSLPVSIYN